VWYPVADGTEARRAIDAIQAYCALAQFESVQRLADEFGYIVSRVLTDPRLPMPWLEPPKLPTERNDHRIRQRFVDLLFEWVMWGRVYWLFYFAGAAAANAPDARAVEICRQFQRCATGRLTAALAREFLGWSFWELLGDFGPIYALAGWLYARTSLARAIRLNDRLAREHGNARRGLLGELPGAIVQALGERDYDKSLYDLANTISRSLKLAGDSARYVGEDPGELPDDALSPEATLMAREASARRQQLGKELAAVLTARQLRVMRLFGDELSVHFAPRRILTVRDLG
jgi:hypothetical protein